MTTASDFLEKTARAKPFTAAGFSNFQKMLKDQGKKAAEESKRLAKKSKKSTDEVYKGFNKGLKKNRERIDSVDKSSTKKALMYGGGAGTAGGYASSQLATSKDDSL